DFDAASWRALKAAGLRPTEGCHILLTASQVKSVDEVNCLKLASSISTSGFQAAFENLKPGVTDAFVARAMMDAMIDAGAEAAHSKVHSGPLSFERSASRGNRRIEYGDLAYFSTCGTSYMGYTV